MNKYFSGITRFMIVCSIFILGGCATGMLYDEAAQTIPALASDKGRVYIYRTTVFGTAIQPAVKVNGREEGKAKPGGFFIVDLEPGTHSVSTTKETQITLNLAANQEVYVRLEMRMGVFVGTVQPVLVDNSVGESEIRKTRYVP